MADIALAGRVIASHYVEAASHSLANPAQLYASPADGAEPLCELRAGDRFALLDDSLGWAWGYAGEGRRVGYVRSEALAPVT